VALVRPVPCGVTSAHLQPKPLGLADRQGSDRGCVSRRGGRSWWAHLAFLRINIELTISKKGFEESLGLGREDRASGEAHWLS
jgi:hypothetical protein